MEFVYTEKKKWTIQFDRHIGKCQIGLFAGNIFFVLIGVALIVVGIVASARTIGKLTTLHLALVFIVLGCIVIVVACLGMLGAKLENKAMLVIYVVLLILFFLAEIAAVIVIFAYRGQLETMMYSAWKSAPDATRQDIQRTESCCGFYKDEADAVCDPCPGCDLPGCAEALYDDIARYQVSIEVTFGILLVAQIAGIVAAAIVCRAVRRSEVLSYDDYEAIHNGSYIDYQPSDGYASRDRRRRAADRQKMQMRYQTDSMYSASSRPYR